MHWPFRRRDPAPPPRRPHARRADPEPAEPAWIDAPDDGPACSACGATETAMADGWAPPICLECDAARNFDELLWEMEERGEDT